MRSKILILLLFLIVALLIFMPLFSKNKRPEHPVSVDWELYPGPLPDEYLSD